MRTEQSDEGYNLVDASSPCALNGAQLYDGRQQPNWSA